MPVRTNLCVPCDRAFDTPTAVVAHVIADHYGQDSPFSTAYVPCTNPKHDHTTTIDRDGMPADPAIPMLCNSCLLPTHYDMETDEYLHDDPAEPDCFLVHTPQSQSPCTFDDAVPVIAPHPFIESGPGQEPTTVKGCIVCPACYQPKRSPWHTDGGAS